MEARTALPTASLTCRRPSSPLNHSGRGQATVPRKGSGRGAVPRGMQKGRQLGAAGVRKKSSIYRERRRHSRFVQGCLGNQLNLNPHQQAQASLSTGARGLGLPSTEARRTSVSSGNKGVILPEVIACLTGPLRHRVRRGLPESSIIAQLGGSVLEIRDTWGVTKESMAGIVSESWLEWGLGEPGPKAPRGLHAGRA